MEESISTFFEHWTAEFAQAVEMFTGERPTLAHKEIEKVQVDEWQARREEIHWWQQETEGSQRFKAWVGAEETCWMTLGGNSENASESKELYQEMLSQANQGAAAVLSSSFPSPVKFGAGMNDTPVSLQALRVAQINVTFKGAPLPPLIVALEPAAAKILGGPEPEPQAPALAQLNSNLPVTNIKVNSTMLDRLMDLQFPVTVLLGQTVLPIRDALKINSGSLIELDRQLGDFVEVMIHGTVVARGEIVSIKGNYGVRIKEVISRKDRFALKDAA